MSKKRYRENYEEITVYVKKDDPSVMIFPDEYGTVYFDTKENPILPYFLTDDEIRSFDKDRMGLLAAINGNKTKMDENEVKRIIDIEKYKSCELLQRNYKLLIESDIEELVKKI